MLARRTLAPSILLALLSVGLTRPAVAQDASASQRPATAEISALEQQLALASGALSSGCAVACPALVAMDRTAQRICALEPGPRCEAARARVRDAARRVQEACPDCRTGAVEERAPVQAATGEKPSTPAVQPSVPTSVSQVSIQSAPRGGGCAGCVVGGEAPTSPWAALVAAAALAVLRRNRRRR